MKPTLIAGDCREVLRMFPSNHFDSVVTDPPYGLSKQPNMQEVLKHWLAGDDYAASGGGFMGKTWDSFVPGPSTWSEVLRVMKPGAYAIVFAGSRTQDLMATSLRLAGFEVLDTLFWLYGSGFPKSMDVAKAVDARDGMAAKRVDQYKFTSWMRENCTLSSTKIDKVLGTNGMGRHFTDVPPGGKQPEVATREHFEKLRPYFEAAVPIGIELLVEQRTAESENLKRREVVGHHTEKAQAAVWRENNGQGSAGDPKAITKAYSEEAQKWEGYGTALKPAYEPMILCRKPLDGTYASNLMAHGCGALNIDGSRNGERWPANILHDGCLPEPMDRYFYCAKATKADRDDGLQHWPDRSAGQATGGRSEGSDGLNSPRSGAGRTGGSKNPHVTVKPTELMRWACGLITPPGGKILDPFCGSGSTGRGAKLGGFEFTGVDLDPVNIAVSKDRIDNMES